MRTILACLALLGAAACERSANTDIPEDAFVAVADGQTTIPYVHAVTGRVPFNMSAPPVPFEVIEGNCRKPKARSRAKAAFVYSYGGSVHVPLHHVNFRDTPEQADARRQAIRAAKGDGPQTPVAREIIAFDVGNKVEWSSRIDVLVTETEAPVFLYLSSYDSILWNIQLAPGAEIDGVVVNSYDAGMIANGVDPDRTAIVSFDNSPSAKCYAKTPVRAVSVSQRTAAARKMNSNFDPRPHIRGWEEEYRKGLSFNADVRTLVGKRPDWIIMTSPDGQGIKAILVGPPPATPFPLQPITRLQIPSHITTYWGSRDNAFRAFGLDAAF